MAAKIAGCHGRAAPDHGFQLNRYGLEPICRVDAASLVGDPPQANELALSRCFLVTLASVCEIQLVELVALRQVAPR